MTEEAGKFPNPVPAVIARLLPAEPGEPVPVPDGPIFHVRVLRIPAADDVGPVRQDLVAQRLPHGVRGDLVRLHLPGHVGLQVRQRNGQDRLPIGPVHRLGIRRGVSRVLQQVLRPLTCCIGHEPVPALAVVLQGEAFPAAAHEAVLIVEEGVSVPPLPGGDGHLGAVVGVPVGPVVGVVLRQVGEVLQPHPVRVRSGQVHAVPEHRVQLTAGHLIGGAVRPLAAVDLMEDDVLVRPDRVRVLVALRHAVVEQLKEVNLFRGLVEGGEELVAEVEGLPVEELLVEHGQLLRRQGPVLRPASGEGAGAHRPSQGQSRRQGGQPGLPVLRNAGDPVPEALLVRGHGGGGQQGAAGPMAHRDEVEQGLAVGDPLPRAQPFQRPLVAGQLAVRAGGGRRQPHQGVEPVEDQAQAPQGAPQGVPVPGVGDLVGQHVAQGLVRGHGRRGEVDGGPEQAEEAGGDEAPVHQIDPAGAPLQGQGDPPPPQAQPEAPVGEQHPQARGPRARRPDGPEEILQADLPAVRNAVGDVAPIGELLGVVPGGGGQGGVVVGGRSHGPPVRRLIRRPDLLIGGLEVDRLALQGPHHRGRHGEDAEVHRRQAHRDQQPGQHQAPQGVLGPAGDLLPEHLPQDQQGQNEHRGGEEHLFHDSPPPAFSRMADSSAMSSAVSCRLSTMALIMEPTLPP